MGLWENYVFPRLMDYGMRGLGDLRSSLLAQARGDVLEIGFGTGHNLRHYPETVCSLTAVDPHEVLPERVERRLARVSFPVERHAVGADEGLPFDSDRFDSVTMTWTLCSIPNPLAALLEIRRVLRPDGVFLFIEHGRSDDPRVERWQQRLTPWQRRFCGGCHLDRRVDALVSKAGFQITQLDRFVPEKAPRIWAEMYQGTARL